MIITNRTARVKPDTNWGQRIKPSTDYVERVKPYRYRAPLRDSTNIVCNGDWKIIYILANEGIPVPTVWQTR